MITKNKQSVARAQKNLLSIDLLLKMGAKTMSPAEVEALKQQKQALQADLLNIEEDEKDDTEVLARRKRFQDDEKVGEHLNTVAKMAMPYDWVTRCEITIEYLVTSVCC